MRSRHSGLLARCAGLGVLVQGRYGDTLGGIRGRHWGDRVGFRGGCTVCAGGGGCLCARGLVSTGQKSGRYVSGAHPLFVGLLTGGNWFQRALTFSGVGGVAVPGLACALWG